MNVIICPMFMTSVMWWINNKNIFPLTKCFVEFFADLICKICLASSFQTFHPAVNKKYSKVSASTLLKLLCHCIQDVFDSVMAEKQNKQYSYEPFSKLGCITTFGHVQNIRMYIQLRCGHFHICICQSNQFRKPISILTTLLQCWYICQIGLQNFHVLS